MNVRSVAKSIIFKVNNILSMWGATNELPDILTARKTLQEYYPPICSTCYTECLWDEKSLNSDNNCELSIILPVYNVEQYVERCVCSVLTQKTDYSYELLIVNDGSLDRSREIIAKFENDPRVTIIDQKNQGLSGARNTALNLIRGKYIMFIDSDDFLCDDAIENLMKCAFTYDADVVAGGYYTIRKGKSSKTVHYKNERVKAQGTYYGMSWGKVYKRWIFHNLRFPDKYWHQDSIFAQIVWPQCEKCYTISEYVYNYLDNGSGISRTSKGKPKSLDSLYITELLLKEKKCFGLFIYDDDYEYFLHMVLLTKKRTNALPDNIKKCIFVVQCELRHRYYKGCKTRKNKKLDKALEEKNYKKYLLI